MYRQSNCNKLALSYPLLVPFPCKHTNQLYLVFVFAFGASPDKRTTTTNFLGEFCQDTNCLVSGMLTAKEKKIVIVLS